MVRVPVEIVIARHEYEAWFLAAAESLRSHPAVRDDAQPPDDPEGKRDAKRQLSSVMTESYKETLHQTTFSAIVDLSLAAERNRSFQRMIHAVALLVDAGDLAQRCALVQVGRTSRACCAGSGTAVGSRRPGPLLSGVS